MKPFNMSSYALNSLSNKFVAYTPDSPFIQCDQIPMAIMNGESGNAIKKSLCADSLTKTYNQAKGIILLHLSALFNRVDLLKDLCPKPLESHPLDSEKNTPLHLRAFSIEGASFEEDAWIKGYISHCVKSSVDKHPLNAQHIDPQSLYELAQSKKKIGSSLVGLNSFVNQEASKFYPISDDLRIEQKCLGENIRWITKMITSPKTLFDQWLFVKPNHTLSIDSSSDEYQKLLNQSSPQVLIRHQEGKGCGVYAEANIPKGSLFSYDGELITYKGMNEFLAHLSGEYSAGMPENTGVKSDVYRSAGSMFNDGLPNLRPFHVSNVEGQKYALQFECFGAKAGEELKWNYGHQHPVKFGRYQLSEEDYKIIKEIVADQGDPIESVFSSSLNFLEKDQKVLGKYFILQTPAVLLKLAADGLLDAPKIFKMLHMMYASGQTNMATQAGLLVSYLISIIRKQCEFKGELEAFNRIIEVMQKYSGHVEAASNKVSGPHKDAFQLTTSVYTAVYVESFFNLLKNIYNNVDMQKAEKKFTNDFVHSTHLKNLEIKAPHSFVKVLQTLIPPLLEKSFLLKYYYKSEPKKEGFLDSLFGW